MSSVGVSAKGPGSREGRGQGHGKIILLGEHSVVYGRPAIAAGLASGCTAQAELAGPAGMDSLMVEPWSVRVEAARPEADPERELLRRGFAVVCEHASQRARLHAGSRSPERQAFAVHANMQIPGGAGLGGSAALSVAVIRALAELQGDAPTDDEVVAASLAWEREFHGNPSGIDSAMAVTGGLCWYVRGQPLKRVSAARGLHLVIGNSGEHGSTKAMVASVARQHARDPAKAEQIFDAIAALVSNAQTELEAGEHARLGQLMDLNQTLLNTLMLSTSKLEQMCQLARGAGALGAKLTGGGGGGCMIALAAAADATQPIVRALESAGFIAFSVEVTA
jgi:mevalonate kinase